MTTEKTPKLPIDRGTYEEAFMNMMSSPKYVQQHFYAFVVSKMQVSINRTVPTAGAGFYDNNFQLVINPDFFNPLPLEQRIGILMHETLHIILKHLNRKGERDHKLFNVACDIALNQKIDRNMLPNGALYPDTFKDEKGKSWPEDETAEFYYELAKKEKEKQEQEKKEKEDQDSEGNEDCDNPGDSEPGDEGDGKGQGEGGEPGEPGQGGNGFKPENGNPNLTGEEEATLDSHDMWGEGTPEEEELAKEMMSKIIDQAIEKSRGNTPGNISDILELWKSKPKLSWKKILKRYISSKKGARQSTIKKRNRRIRVIGIKGNKVSYDMPNVVVGIDTSGSMSDEEIQSGLIEIADICRKTNSSMQIAQIDTRITGLETFNEKSKAFKRKGYGGTYMGAMAQYLKEKKVNYDVLVMVSDMYIEDVSTDSNWGALKKPTIWLNTSGTEVAWKGSKGHVVYDIADA